MKIIRNILVLFLEPVGPVMVLGSLIKGRMESREEHLSELKKQHETVEDEVFLTFCQQVTYRTVKDIGHFACERDFCSFSKSYL